MQRIIIAVPPVLPLVAAFYLATLSLTRTKLKNSLVLVEAFVYLALCAGGELPRTLVHATDVTTSTSMLNRLDEQ